MIVSDEAIRRRAIEREAILFLCKRGVHPSDSPLLLEYVCQGIERRRDPIPKKPLFATMDGWEEWF